MPAVPTAGGSAVPVIAAPAAKVQPAPLSRNEKWLAALLIVIGAVLIAILLSAFMGRSESWSLKSKETTETTTATAETGGKEAKTVEYSDSVLIAGLGLGALFLLTGAFYGRIREITLPGGAGLKLGELPPAKEQELSQAIGEKAQQKAATVPASAEQLAAEARKQAQVLLQDHYWGIVPEPPKEDLDGIAEQAIERAKQILS